MNDARLEALLPGEPGSATQPTDVLNQLARIYTTLGEVVDLLQTLEAATSHLSESIAGLPGIVGGLRIDAIGDPVCPETVRDSAAGDLIAAARNLDLAQDAANRALQSMSSLYVEQL